MFDTFAAAQPLATVVSHPQLIFSNECEQNITALTDSNHGGFYFDPVLQFQSKYLLRDKFGAER